MSDVKKIALVTCASNFERQKNIVKAVHQKLKKMGSYALYVFTSYGLFREDTLYDKGEASIYNLLEKTTFDGCILEGNIGNSEILKKIIELFRSKNVPLLTLSIGMEDVEVPFVLLDSYDAGCQLVQHLIEKHHCDKINLIYSGDMDVFNIQTLRAYQETLEKNGIPFDKDRIIEKAVSIKSGKEAVDIFEERGVNDAQAIICIHDVYAIGLCMELKKRGIRVPEDILVGSLNRSSNSIIFRPDITGADRMDRELAEKACELLDAMIAGKQVPVKNYIKGKICLGESCGCVHYQEKDSYDQYCDIVLSKVEAGNQVSRLMQYNDSLDEVASLDELIKRMKIMLEGIDCSRFIFSMNRKGIQYVTTEIDSMDIAGEAFDPVMTAVVGYTDKTGEIKNVNFPIEKLLPMEVEEGDILLFYPIHHNGQVYGYLTIVNEYLPIDMYNYRICHESIGISLENLHRQVILRESIKALDELHMKDALTGLYNRFAWNRFCKQYVDAGKYCVAILDMDGLKRINDNFGHLAGNNAICILANVIKTTMEENDLVTRCGGDEFQVVSYNTDDTYWENMQSILNEKITAQVEQQKLPYELGVSLGYCICDEEHSFTFEECCERADQYMYENKKIRKQCRQE